MAEHDHKRTVTKRAMMIFEDAKAAAEAQHHRDHDLLDYHFALERAWLLGLRAAVSRVLFMLDDYDPEEFEGDSEDAGYLRVKKGEYTADIARISGWLAPQYAADSDMFIRHFIEGAIAWDQGLYLFRDKQFGTLHLLGAALDHYDAEKYIQELMGKEKPPPNQASQASG